MPYCQFCGLKLEEGQTCTCETTQSADSQPLGQQYQPPVQTTPATPSRAAVVLKELKAYLRAYIANPAQAVPKEINENKLTLSIALSVVRMLAVGLAIYGLLRKICDDALSALTTTLLKLDGIGGALTVGLTAPLSQCLLYGVLIAASGMLLFLAMAFVIVKIQHGGITLVNMFKASASNGILTSALLILSFLSSFISVKFCIGFIVLASLSWIISGVLTVCIVTPNSHKGVVWIMYFVGVVLVIAAGAYVIPPLFFRAVGEISVSYAGQTMTLQAMIDTASVGLNTAIFEEFGVSNLTEYLKENWRVALESLFEEFVYALRYNTF